MSIDSAAAARPPQRDGFITPWQADVLDSLQAQAGVRQTPRPPQRATALTKWQAEVLASLKALESKPPPAVVPQIRVTRPNIDDRLVEVWNGTGWSVTAYDSGWRQVSSWPAGGPVTGLQLGPGWAPASSEAGWIKCQRLGSELLVIVHGLKTAMDDPKVLITLPSGFSPMMESGSHLAASEDRGWDLLLLPDGRLLGNRWSIAPDEYWVTSSLARFELGNRSIPTSLPGSLQSAAPK
jgi:hypothetical protein